MKKTILEIYLYATYYKKDITNRYIIANRSLIIENEAIDILDKPEKKLYIETWTKHIEKDKEIERLKSIIKEIRKHIEEEPLVEDHYDYEHSFLEDINENYYKKLKEILDKENK